MQGRLIIRFGPASSSLVESAILAQWFIKVISVLSTILRLISHNQYLLENFFICIQSRRFETLMLFYSYLLHLRLDLLTGMLVAYAILSFIHGPIKSSVCTFTSGNISLTAPRPRCKSYKCTDK